MSDPGGDRYAQAGTGDAGISSVHGEAHTPASQGTVGSNQQGVIDPVASEQGIESGSPAGSPERKKTWKKPEGMPKRPLSAYNLFFRFQRQQLLGEDLAKEYEITSQTKRKHRKTHGKIGFTELAREIGNKWKEMDAEERRPFEDEAKKEKEKYAIAKEVWKKEQEDAKYAHLQTAQQRQQGQNWGSSQPQGGEWGQYPNAMDSVEGIERSLIGSTARPSSMRMMPSIRAASIPGNLEGGSYGMERMDDLRLRAASLGGTNTSRQSLSEREIHHRKMQMEMHLQRAAALHEELQSVGASNPTMEEMNLPNPAGDASLAARSQPSGLYPAFDSLAHSGFPRPRPDVLLEANRLGGGGTDWIALEQRQQQQQQQYQQQQHQQQQHQQHQQLLREQELNEQRMRNADILALQQRPEYLALEQRRLAVERSLELERHLQREEDFRLLQRQRQPPPPPPPPQPPRRPPW